MVCPTTKGIKFMLQIIEACCKCLCNVQSLTLSDPSTFRKPLMATCPAGTMMVLCSLYAYKENAGLVECLL